MNIRCRYLTPHSHTYTRTSAITIASTITNISAATGLELCPYYHGLCKQSATDYEYGKFVKDVSLSTISENTGYFVTKNIRTMLHNHSYTKVGYSASRSTNRYAATDRDLITCGKGHSNCLVTGYGRYYLFKNDLTLTTASSTTSTNKNIRSLAHNHIAYDTIINPVYRDLLISQLACPSGHGYCILSKPYTDFLVNINLSDVEVSRYA